VRGFPLSGFQSAVHSERPGGGSDTMFIGLSAQYAYLDLVLARFSTIGYELTTNHRMPELILMRDVVAVFQDRI
jgi:hypothetical protein